MFLHISHLFAYVFDNTTVLKQLIFIIFVVVFSSLFTTFHVTYALSLSLHIKLQHKMLQITSIRSVYACDDGQSKSFKNLIVIAQWNN